MGRSQAAPMPHFQELAGAGPALGCTEVPRMLLERALQSLAEESRVLPRFKVLAYPLQTEVAPLVAETGLLQPTIPVSLQGMVQAKFCLSELSKSQAHPSEPGLWSRECMPCARHPSSHPIPCESGVK